jgi:2-methylcitrate dehydratase PrpD
MASRLMGLDRLTLANALALQRAGITPLVVRHGAISAAKSVANALVAQNACRRRSSNMASWPARPD